MKHRGPIVEVLQAGLQQAVADGATCLSIADATDLSPLRGQPITWLSLAGSRVDHRQLKHLADCPLEHLDLSQTALVELEPIRRALEARPDDMTARMVIAEVWAERYEFRWEPGPEAEFHLEDDTPSPVDPDAWIEALGEEDLVAVEVPAHERMALLLQAAELYDLDLRALHGPLDGLGSLPTCLRGLHLSGTPVADEELAHLVRLTELRLLDVSGTAITQVGRLSSLPLRALDLSGTQAVGPFPQTVVGLRLGKGVFGADRLSGLPALASLAIVDAELGPDALGVLPASLRQLTLYRCQLNAAGTWSLASLPELTDVDLTRCRLSQADRAGLGALGGLRSLRLSRTDLVAEDLEILAALDGLPLLALGFMDIEPPVLEAFAASMSETTVQLAYEAPSRR